jgi:hypothetical protein
MELIKDKQYTYIGADTPDLTYNDKVIVKKVILCDNGTWKVLVESESKYLCNVSPLHLKDI